MAKRRRTDRTLDDWLNGSGTQRDKTVCDGGSISAQENVVLGEDERENVVLDKDEDQEPCTIVITDDESDEIESEDGERDGDCLEMDSTGSEVLAPSTRSSPISFTPEDEARACEDCEVKFKG